MFYDRVRLALKEIDVSEWHTLWNDFWSVEQKNHISDKKRKSLESEAAEEEFEVEEEEGRQHLFSDDEDM